MTDGRFASNETSKQQKPQQDLKTEQITKQRQQHLNTQQATRQLTNKEQQQLTI
jgi:hypothetical protein